MKTLGQIFVGVLLLLGLAVCQDKKATNADVPKFDVDNQQTLTGTVQEVKDYKCPVTGTVGTHLTVKYLGGTVEAHLAPASFLKEFDIKFKQWDDVKIVGTRVTFDGKPAILVRQVTVRNETFNFRDPKGRPLWQ